MGSCVPAPTGRPVVINGVCEGNRVEYRAVEGEGPVPVGACPADRDSRVARVPWNPV